jgi:hypothetical protein
VFEMPRLLSRRSDDMSNLPVTRTRVADCGNNVTGRAEDRNPKHRDFHVRNIEQQCLAWKRELLKIVRGVTSGSGVYHLLQGRLIAND